MTNHETVELTLVHSYKHLLGPIINKELRIKNNEGAAPALGWSCHCDGSGYIEAQVRAFQEKANLHRKEAVGAPREESVSEKSEQNESASYMLRIKVCGFWTLESERHSMPT